jgi:hypothetical protein
MKKKNKLSDASVEILWVVSTVTLKRLYDATNNFKTSAGNPLVKK